MPTPRATNNHSRLWALMGCGCAVPAVLGILVIFGMLWLNDARAQRDPRWSRQSLAACERNMKTISLALDSYTSDHRHPPERLLDLAPRYIDEPALHCPLEASGGAPYGYNPAGADALAAIVTCANHAHGPVALLRNGTIRPPKGW